MCLYIEEKVIKARVKKIKQQNIRFWSFILKTADVYQLLENKKAKRFKLTKVAITNENFD
ncbi:hypothetical protein LguiB_034362 [Lonicera macranthoides]